MSATEMRSPLRWLTEAQVADLVDINDAMAALRVGFVEEADGIARTVDKALGTWDGGAMHALGSMMPNEHRAGFKTWAHTTGGATAVYALFHMRDGRLLSMLEAATLGQIRTSAVSGLGADLLASPETDEMAIVGTGAQALSQVAAVAAVRPLRRLRVFSRRAEPRAAFVQKAREAFDIEVIDCPSIEAAVNGLPLVTLITRSSEPFLKAGMLAPGALVIAAGSILPSQAECHRDVLEASGLFVVDSLGNAQRGSRELRDVFGEGPEGWDDVRTLGAILRDGVVRPAGGAFTFFKPMGSGLSDLAVAMMAHERAESRGVGLAIDQPSRVMPKWRAAMAAQR
jgi:ornithine cyclodeaminase/alanine dehydrogenase-like protein (mu-crystallin family)